MNNARIIFYKLNDESDEEKDEELDEEPENKIHKQLIKKLESLNSRSEYIKERVEGQKEKRLGEGID